MQKLRVYPKRPAPRHIRIIVDVLKNGGLVIFPTDTVYAIGCRSGDSRAIDRLSEAVGKKRKKANLSMICSGLSNISQYTRPFDKRVFKVMRRSLPGPFTFILRANHQIPQIFRKNKKTVGIRVPDNPIPRKLVEALNEPLVSTSLNDNDEILQYPTDPDEIYRRFKGKADLLVHGGAGDNEPSTVLDCTNDEPEILREGKGSLEELY